MALRSKGVSRSAWIAAGFAFVVSVAACTSTADSAAPIEVLDQTEATESDSTDSVDAGGQTEGDQLAAITPTENDSDSVEQVASLLSSMSQEEKVGQLLMPVLAGTQAEVTTPGESADNRGLHGYDTPAEVIRQYKVGGVIYLQNNVSSAEQLRSMSRGLQAASQEVSSTGLLMAIDQEGGKVSRVSDEVTKFESAQELSGDEERVNEAAFITGQQLRYQGINVVLAPVADVLPDNGAGFIADRSYGSDPEEVAKMVVASVNGLQQSGVAAAAKHWPGHGPTFTDSHDELPVLDMSKQDWVARDRIPFEAAIEQDVAIVLVGHLSVPQLDASGSPATSSEVIIQQLLKDELGFEGVVMTDAANMGAIADTDDFVVDSVAAGVDILLIPPSLSATVGALNAGISDGRISQDRLDDAVTRVLTLKQKLGLLE